ncbi:MAG: NlpC/P60 family protein [Muricoprocola sp.]
MGYGQKAVDLAISRQGKNQYTQSADRVNVFSGWSDCSSLCWKCFEKAYGIYIGSWTGEQVTKGRQIIKRNQAVPYARISSAELAKMQPGDLIFYGDGNAYHVEMYIGNGKQIGHGSGWGPTIKDCLSYSHSHGFYQVRRYVNDDSPMTNQPVVTETTGKKGIADKYDAAITGTYSVTADDYLCLRLSANTSSDSNIIEKMKPGEKISCYGYYTMSDGVKWLYAIHDGNVGFCSCEYLKKE